MSAESIRPTLDVKAVADYLGISAVTVKRRIADGSLKAYKNGGYWKIKREWLIEHERSLIEPVSLKVGKLS
ncbi:excisionase family DNA binding protein [Paenibacillus cellulosilyticus]|uniref:Excisionase family DNA binding protein n=1 Tax=Paenibacillus cellulosilyticus TaxID=375489 RepID=A0A2V2YSB1_9BACL|nr:helix-turn-helix domain-containing protein [Paenibacillus cellulosilyticus]PWV97472.1 excisionase family DNA binding protein [Paenibacillus cellulosilyticus]QKS48491.1 helix-turn-helix domain-containing protein [Paenibacillus cellulosilyticus]